MITDIKQLRAKCTEVLANLGKMPEAIVLCHSLDDWRTLTLRAGVEPLADDKAREARFEGIRVRPAPALCGTGELLLMIGLPEPGIIPLTWRFCP